MNPTISKLQSIRDHCKKYSKKWHKLNKVIIRLKRKQSNQIKDFQHKLSRKLVDNTRANTIIIGDLTVKKMTKSKNKGLNRSIQNTGYLARFVEFLTYKAELVGKRIIKIDEAYTSKTCCKCGKIHEMKLYNRTRLVNVETISTVIKTAVSTSCYVSYHKMACGQPIKHSLIICDKQSHPTG